MKYCTTEIYYISRQNYFYIATVLGDFILEISEHLFRLIIGLVCAEESALSVESVW